MQKTALEHDMDSKETTDRLPKLPPDLELCSAEDGGRALKGIRSCKGIYRITKRSSKSWRNLVSPSIMAERVQRAA